MVCDTNQTNNEQLRGEKLLLTISLLTRLFILLLVLPVLSHLRAPSCFLALWGSSCIVPLSCGLEKFPLASFFWPWSATSRSFPWDISVERCRGFDSRFELLGSAINLVHSPVPQDCLKFFLFLPPFKQPSKNNGALASSGELAQYLLLQHSFFSSGLSGYI